jgi:hypothetical protein
VIQITVWGARFETSATTFPGHRTGGNERVYAYNWTTSPPAVGSQSASSALKVEVRFEKAGLWSYGRSCVGSNRQTPICSTSGSGRLGTTYNVILSNALPNANAFLSIGIARWNPPLSLGIIGAPNCNMYFNNDVTLGVRCDSSGRFVLNLPVPANTATCLGFYFQYFPFDRSANRLGLTTTNYVRLTTGY